MNIENEKLKSEVAEMCNMCIAMGIHKNVYEGELKYVSHMPISFYPYEITETTYQKLRKAHLIWVKLLLKVSKDKEFVNKVFERTAKHDPFVNKYLDLYNKYVDLEDYGVTCIRIDYMGDEKPQLVEFNLICVGFNGVSDGVQKLAQLYKKHRYIENEVYYPDSKNQASMLNAIQLTLKQEKITGIALILVHENEKIQFCFGDLNSFELQTLKRNIKVKRVTMTEFMAHYKINDKKQLFYNQQKVALVYLRTGYSPSHYHSERHWFVRQEIERANVLSIPSVSMQLVNFKRMQVQLSKLDVLKKFLDEKEALLLKELSGELYDFQNETQIEKLQKLASTNNYVLKSNREGGGNNYFGEEAANKITQLSKVPGELEKYILQNKIKSDIQDNIFIANHQHLEVKECTCEFSTFGSYAYKRDQFRFNECAGNLIRLKRAEQNEGGISIGKAVIAGLCVKKSQ